MVTSLVPLLREAYGWTAEVVVVPGPRGARGQIWRLEVGDERYALKEMFTAPPSEQAVAAEVAFGERARAAGVRLPGSHPDRSGRYLLATPEGSRLRLYDWVDVTPLSLAGPDAATAGTAEALGVLLARLHRCAPAATTEADGGPPDPWYDSVPARSEFEAVLGSARAQQASPAWVDRLAERLPDLDALSALVGPTDPSALRLCHRDLHPENVLAAPDGGLVVVDWDGSGPAEPSRELAGALLDWFCDGSPDLGAITGLHAAYRATGGPGRVTSPADFTMLLAGRLRFLLGQLRLALDARVEARHRAWAEHEIDEGLRILPTPAQLEAVLGALGQPSSTVRSAG